MAFFSLSDVKCFPVTAKNKNEMVKSKKCNCVFWNKLEEDKTFHRKISLQCRVNLFTIKLIHYSDGIIIQSSYK